MKELLFSITKKDFEITYFSGKGKGGQHRNKHQNCVRLKHKESGIISTGQNFKERSRNLREALKNLTDNPKFKLWLNGKIFVEERVDDLMSEGNLKVEYFKGRQLWQGEE